jgi:hypothetical protein
MSYAGGMITGIQKVLGALGKGVYRDGVYYIYIHSPETSTPFLYVPYQPTYSLSTSESTPPKPLIMFSDYNRSIDIISPNSFFRNNDCNFPRFQLFSYINIFWKHYRPSFSPNNYRYFNTLPLLNQETITPSDGTQIIVHKPEFCITGDILDFCFSLILTFITFVPPPEINTDGGINLTPSCIDNNTNIRYINYTPATDGYNVVILTKNTLTMTGGMKTKPNHHLKRKVSYSNTKRRINNVRKSMKKYKSKKVKKSKSIRKQNKMKLKFTKKISSNTKKG